MSFDRQGENAGLQEREKNPTIPFLPFPPNTAAMLYLSFLVSLEGQRGNMSKFQFWLSSVTARVNILLVKLRSLCQLAVFAGSLLLQWDFALQV